MVESILGLIGVAVLVAFLSTLAWRWMPHFYNPVFLGILSWAPALLMVNFPPYFIHPLYMHQNIPFSVLVFVALGMAFLGFWLGCAIVRAVSAPDAFELQRGKPPLPINDRRLFGMFVVGLAIFLYGYLSSGLFNLSTMDSTEIAESRVALHLGPVSFLQVLMEFAALGFYVRYLQGGRLYYLLPIVIAFASYSLTLQKSSMMWIFVLAATASAVYPGSFYRRVLSSVAMRIVVFVAALGLIMLLFLTNTLRGITETAMTTSTSFLEQSFIYSGASAIKNLSVSIQGYLQSDGPLFGANLLRPILWNVLDRDLFVSGRYFEGVNTGTYLNVAWIDFRWLGFFITPLIYGIVVTLFIRQALKGGLFALFLGAVALRAVVYSNATDTLFDPTTWYFIIIAFIADRIATVRARTLTARTSLTGPKRLTGTPLPSHQVADKYGLNS